MARKKTAPSKTETRAAEKSYTVEALGAHCLEVLGVSSATYAGATAGLDTKKKYTVGEMKEIIAGWSGKGVR